MTKERIVLYGLAGIIVIGLLYALNVTNETIEILDTIEIK